MLLHVREMLGETLLSLDAVFRATHRPPQDHAERGFRMGDGKRYDRTATHAAAHQVRLFDTEMVEQAFALRNIVRPRDALDAAARLPRLATVEHDATIVLRQVIERLHPRVDTERAPFLERGVEATRREHQERRPRADDVVACHDAIDDCRGHWDQREGFTGIPPLICRPDRTSSA